MRTPKSSPASAKTTDDDFARESKRIEAELRDLDRLAPAPVPAAFDPAEVTLRIIDAFAQFASQPIGEQRDLLRMVFREIVLGDGTVVSMTLNGGFLNSLAHVQAFAGGLGRQNRLQNGNSSGQTAVW